MKILKKKEEVKNYVSGSKYCCCCAHWRWSFNVCQKSAKQSEDIIQRTRKYYIICRSLMLSEVFTFYQLTFAFSPLFIFIQLCRNILSVSLSYLSIIKREFLLKNKSSPTFLFLDKINIIFYALWGLCC